MSSRLLAFGLAWICALTAVAGASQGGPATVGSRLYLPCGNGTPYPAPDFGEDNQPSLAQLSAVGDVWRAWRPSSACRTRSFCARPCPYHPPLCGEGHPMRPLLCAGRMVC